MSACTNQGQDSRSSGSPIEGIWAFGPDASCETNTPKVHIFDDAWMLIVPDPNLPDVLLARNFSYRLGAGEVFINLEYLAGPNNGQLEYYYRPFIYRDEGFQLVATDLFAEGQRVPLSAIGVDPNVSTHILLYCDDFKPENEN